jgi:hypothetical protein
MMDFLDPKKRRIHVAKLYIGYFLIGIAVVLATVLLLYVAYGFGLNKGQVVQNGLVFVSSTPSGSSIYLNGQLKGTTGKRLTLTSGTYTMKIQRNGYRTWQRAVTVEGGTVERFDYPFLFPTNLQTTTTKAYTSAPALATQSPDRRWLLIEQPGSLSAFDMYDLKNPKQVIRSTVTLPSAVLTASDTKKQSLKLAEWSDDNQHVLLEHIYGSSHEYIMLDTQTPAQSVNVTKALGLTPTDQLKLQNKQYDHYFVYDAKTAALDTDTLGNPTLTPLLTHVLAYKTYGTNMVLYTTTQNATAGQSNVMLYQNNKSYELRTLPVDKTYLLNLTQYSGSWYVAAGARNEGRVYVYKDPVSMLNQKQGQLLAPATILQVDKPDYLEFSANAQFIMAEHANQFAVYDAQYDKTYAYTIDAHFDAPQPHATWMDGDRITYVSGGKLAVFDYDSTNLQTLMPSSSYYLPFFDQNYHFVYDLAASAATAKTPAQMQLTSTALLTPADQ